MKALIEAGAYRATKTALERAASDFYLDELQDLANVVLGLTACEFYKSMTTYADHKTWQDVYHASVNTVSAYIKVQIVDRNTVIISFKRLEHGDA